MNPRTRGSTSLLVAVLWVTSQGSAEAQGSILTFLSSSTVSFPVPTSADYDLGVVQATTPLDFEVTQVPLTTGTVEIRATGATLGGGKDLGDLEWRLVGGSTWQPVTGTFALVDQRTADGLDTTWSGSIEFRIILAYGLDPPGAYGVPLEVRLTITLV